MTDLVLTDLITNGENVKLDKITVGKLLQITGSLFNAAVYYRKEYLASTEACRKERIYIIRYKFDYIGYINAYYEPSRLANKVLLQEKSVKLEYSYNVNRYDEIKLYGYAINKFGVITLVQEIVGGYYAFLHQRAVDACHGVSVIKAGKETV